ncbi:MAG: patatin-like phospholipase family protein [Bacteroidota bacterium]
MIIRVCFYILFLSNIPFCLFSQVNVSDNEENRPKIGLILSGGGAKGLAHVGALKVLEEAGIRPDFIGGTSMGSIVGGLYAIGYSADSLEIIAQNTDWDRLIGDVVFRWDLAIEEKEDNDRFFISFPIQERKIKIPSGLVNGQNIENYLNKLCAPVYNIRNFNDFDIPFLCIATDIETGEEVIFREGYLPEILRASMSIPSIFEPIEIDFRLLVDGGLVNNFPVARVRDMGADILIGVDVGFRYYEKEELTSIFKILEQSVFFYGEALNEYNESLCDILIEPDLFDYNASSFGSTDTLIAIGENSTRRYLPLLKALADSIYKTPPIIENRHPPKLDSLTLTEVRVEGLDKVSMQLLTGKLQLEINQKVTPGMISRAVERLYSSLYFEKVRYTIEELDSGIRLNLSVEEARGGEFQVGLHYDTNYRSAILINTTFRNVLFDGSKLSASLALGENPYFHTSFFKNNGWKPGFGIDFTTSRLEAFVYEQGRRISSLAYAETSTELYMQSIFSNSYAVGAGIEYEATSITPRIDPIFGFEKAQADYWNYYSFLDFDSYDHPYYPNSGVKLNLTAKLITEQNFDPTFFFVTRYSQAYELGKRLTFINHIHGGAVDGDTIPYQYNFYSGGVNPTPRNGLLPFIGLNYMELMSKNALIVGADLQYELFPNIYVMLRGNIGNMRNNFAELVSTDKLYGGYGITLGYDSWIGPIEVSALKTVRKPRLTGFLNIGFWF